jgi:hypothetical protein
MNLLVTPPFDSPIPPRFLDLRTELIPILAEHGIRVVTDPARADLELAGQAASLDPARHRLPRNRVVIMDGEPPQPEFLLPFYTGQGWAGVLCPGNLLAYADDGLAHYDPPLPERPKVTERGMRVVQLATFRSRPGNLNEGKFLLVNPNGEGAFAYRILCNLRVQVGLALQALHPETIDLYGRGWPAGTATVENSRGRLDFLEVRHDIAQRYAFDLCWENMEVPYYVTEKFWSPVRMGVLPIYWGPPEFHNRLPADTLVDARRYLSGSGYDVGALAYDLRNMSFSEYHRRTERLLDWYYDLPRDSHRRSWVAAAHRMARALLDIAGRAGKRADLPVR